MAAVWMKLIGLNANPGLVRIAVRMRKETMTQRNEMIVDIEVESLGRLQLSDWVDRRH